MSIRCGEHIPGTKELYFTNHATSNSTLCCNYRCCFRKHLLGGWKRWCIPTRPSTPRCLQKERGKTVNARAETYTTTYKEPNRTLPGTRPSTRCCAACRWRTGMSRYDCRSETRPGSPRSSGPRLRGCRTPNKAFGWRKTSRTRVSPRDIALAHAERRRRRQPARFDPTCTPRVPGNPQPLARCTYLGQVTNAVTSEKSC